MHKDKYDYSKVEYSSALDKVNIICPTHGEFLQNASEHLRGRGCPKCGNSFPLSLQDFIDRARKIHGDRYDYSEAQYVNFQTKICIICPKHGKFWTTPDNHINKKSGCPKCNNSKGEL